MVYNLVIQRNGKFLYEKVKDIVNTRVTQRAKELSKANVDLVGTIIQEWNMHIESMKMIHDVFMYLEKTYVVENSLVSLFNYGLILFRDNVCTVLQLKTRIIDTLLVEIEKLRNYEFVDKGLHFFLLI
jgi:hypothetical protein